MYGEYVDHGDGPGNPYPYIAARAERELEAAQRELAALKEKTKYAYASEDALISSDFFQGALKNSLAFKDREILALRNELLKLSSAAPAAPSMPATGGWISVKDQLPPCRDDQDYIGINSAGFAGIFNAIADIAGNVHCMMETAEESVSIMSDLSIWKPFTRPLPASPTIEGESNG